MKFKALKAAFPHTVPILTGFCFLGMAYGIYMNASGFPFWYPLCMSVLIYGGSLEFVCVEMLLSPFAPVQSSQSCFRIRQTGPELRARAADRREPGPSAGAAYRICCRSGRSQRPPHRSSGSGAQTRQPERPPDGRFWCRRRRRTENRKESLRRTAGI